MELYGASRINHRQKRPIIKLHTKETVRNCGRRRLHGQGLLCTGRRHWWETQRITYGYINLHQYTFLTQLGLSHAKTFHTSNKLLAVNSQPYSTSSSPFSLTYMKLFQFYFSDMSLPPSDHAWLKISRQTRSSSVGLDD